MSGVGVWGDRRSNVAKRGEYPDRPLQHPLVRDESRRFEKLPVRGDEGELARVVVSRGIRPSRPEAYVATAKVMDEADAVQRRIPAIRCCARQGEQQLPGTKRPRCLLERESH